MLRGLRRISLAFSTLVAGAAQAPPVEVPVLQFTGKPIQAECACTAEDIVNAGLACTEDEPCPLFLELTSVEPVGNKIFVAGNFHTATATLYSLLLSSDDSGKTWREPFERLRASGLDHIQFVDFEHGWISGQILQPLPQDPFFLITSDGGKSWRRRPLFSESRSGSIAQFGFTSRSAGGLVLDRGESGRYELYETPNSGETWMLREASDKPLRLRRTTSPNADWRIRADRSSRAFWIERRQAEKWSAVAAFAVSAGVCKPAPEGEPAPQPEPESAPKPVPKR